MFGPQQYQVCVYMYVNIKQYCKIMSDDFNRLTLDREKIKKTTYQQISS